MKKPLSPICYLLSAIVALALSACASQRETMTSAYHGAEVVSSGPVAADDAAMKQKPGTVKSKRTASTSSKSNGTDTEMNSTETTTVVGSSAVAAPDSEVKFHQ
jgi:hypothetical protein